MNSICKQYEGKLHIRFNEGGVGGLLIIITFTTSDMSRLSGSILQFYYEDV